MNIVIWMVGVVAMGIGYGGKDPYMFAIGILLLFMVMLNRIREEIQKLKP